MCNLITAMLFRVIRRFKNHGQDLTGKNLMKEEIILLTTLHSSSNNSRFFWDFGSEENQKLINPNGDEYDNLDKVKLRISDFDEKNEHDFKITKIHDWIDKMTLTGYNGEYPIRDSVRQNMITGCSTIIDSVFANLRNTIVTRFGASSILVDGGGRIRFYAKGISNIEEEITEVIYNTFMRKDDYSHPFNNIIIESVKEYKSKFKTIYGEKNT